MDEVEENKYTPRSPKVSQPFSTKNRVIDTVDVAPDALHRASGDTSTANCTASDRSADATSP